MTTRLALPLALLSLLAVACNPTTDNLNDPGLTPVFTIAYDLSEAPRVTDATYFGLVWVRYTDDGPLARLGGVLPSGATTQGQLEIFGPPPADMLNDIDGAQVGLGYVVVLEDRDEDGWFAFDGDRLLAPDAAVGVAFDQVVVYLDDPFADVGELIANPEKLSAGYHLGHSVCGDRTDSIQIADAGEKMSVMLYEPGTVLPETCTDFF